MKKSLIGGMFVFLLFSLLVPSFCDAKVKVNKQELLKILDPIVDKTLAAYNSNDDVKFYDYFAQEMHDVTTPKDFKAYYIDIYKKEIGDYISRILLEEKCSFDEFYPVAVYKGEFKKNKKVIITVNFVNEHGFYRITRVEFDKKYYDDYK
jgi:hypothetical protein